MPDPRDPTRTDDAGADPRHGASSAPAWSDERPDRGAASSHSLPAGRERPDTATLVRFINERHGTRFALGERFPTGEQGAFALVEPGDDGPRRVVLKWDAGSSVPDDVSRAISVTERLRAIGYPTPRFLFADVAAPLGVNYSVQEALPGSPLGGQLDRTILDELLRLNDFQRDAAERVSSDWPRPVAEPVLHGGDGYCLLEAMRSSSSRTAGLLDTAQRLVSGLAAPARSGRDVVHFDFQGANILVDDGRVSGVVDWTGCLTGDRAFDLATLFFYADADEAGHRERLWTALVDRTEPGLLAVYLAHLIVRQVDWSLRFHDPNAVERWIRRSEEVVWRLMSGARATSPN